MKKMLVFLAIFVAFPVRFGSAVEVTNTTVTDFVTANGNLVCTIPCNQTDLFWSLPKGFYVDLWVSAALDGGRNNGQEIDYSVGWSNDRWDVGVSLYDLNRVMSVENPDILNFHVETRRGVKVFGQEATVFLKQENLLVTRETNRFSSTLSSVGARHSFRVLGISLSQDFRAAYDAGIFAGDTGWLVVYSANASTTVSGLPLFAGVKQFTPTKSISDRGNHTVLKWGVNFGI